MRELKINGAFVSEHSVHTDSRGIFREWFKSSDLKQKGVDFQVEQANFSMSNKGVLRGVHFSIGTKGQAKLVTCAFGEILDVIIDLRIDSPTYLQVEKIPLTADSGDVLYIPTGVGHSFLVLSELASVTYLTSSEFDPESEKTISPMDPVLGLEWPKLEGTEFSLSDRDLNAPSLSQAVETRILPKFKG